MILSIMILSEFFGCGFASPNIPWLGYYSDSFRIIHCPASFVFPYETPSSATRNRDGLGGR